MPDAPTELENVRTRHDLAERTPESVLQVLAGSLLNDERLRALIDGYPEFCFVLDENRQLVACNQYVRDLLGPDKVSSLVGQRPGELLGCEHAHDAPGGCGTGEACQHCGAFRTIRQSQKTREATRGECRICVETPSGPVSHELEVAVSPLHIDSANLLIFAARDVSDVKRRSVLERIFFHDVLNLAGAITGQVQAWTQSPELVTPASLQRLAFLGNQLVDQIKAQRDLIYAERGELSTVATRVVVAELLQELRETLALHPVAIGRSIVVAPTDADLAMSADVSLLRRVLVNLIKNALEAIRAGQTVTLSCEAARNDRLRFRVHNPGVIPREVQLQLFQRSFSTKGGTGRGLGTYSVKLLTTAYLHGQVRFRSNAEEGTSFDILLPRGETQPATGVASAAAEPEHRLEGVRVLVVDDSEDNRRIVTHHLRRAGASVRTAANGAEAIEAAFQPNGDGHSPNVILMDADMPVMDGVAATRCLRERGYAGGIVALTADSSVSARNELINAGCNVCLAKPADRIQLVATVRAQTSPPASLP